MAHLLPPYPPQLRELIERSRVQRTGPEGAQIQWRIWGEGPPLLLFHGGHGSWMHWARNIDALSAKHQVILADLPGFGASDPLRDDSLEEMSARFLDGIDALALPERFHLGGFSFGTIPACDLIAPLRHRLYRLFLIGAGSFGGFSPVDRLHRWQDVPPGPERDAANRANLEILMFHRPDTVDETALRIQAYNTEHTRQDMRKLAIGSDLRAPLSTAGIRITAIWGAEDALTRGGYLEQRAAFLAGLSPAGETVLLPDTGHWLQYESPQATNDVIVAAMAQDLKDSL